MIKSTPDKIFAFIKQNNGSTAKGIIDSLELNAAGIFRHLRRLQEQRKIYKIGKPPKVKYYAYINMDNKLKAEEGVFNWAVSGGSQYINSDIFCFSRDIFQARIDHLISSLKTIIKNDDLVYLLAAVAGEIGNNSFDHNLGHWRDAPGVYFKLELSEREIILADRGQGVYATIKGVRPQVKNDEEALKVAFTELISGRAPEKRGNGLKFVRKIIEENKLNLRFFTGNAVCRINGAGMEIKKNDIQVPGTLVIIKF
jgi:molybdopterin converting factor small subunit